MREGCLSKKEAILFSVLAISGLVALLYLAAFAEILLLAHRTGLVVIKADSLMPVESALMLSASVVMVFVTIYSVAAIVSELTPKMRMKKLFASAVFGGFDSRRRMQEDVEQYVNT